MRCPRPGEECKEECGYSQNDVCMKKRAKNEMSDGDICMMYKQAKNKKQQIQILAEMNRTTKEEIMKILVENGEKIPITNAKKPSKEAADKKWRVKIWRRRQAYRS